MTTRTRLATKARSFFARTFGGTDSQGQRGRLGQLGRLGFLAVAGAALVGGPLYAPRVSADPPPNPECTNGWCGTPRQTGGGGCGCGGGGSILVNNTDDGKTYQYTDDFDADGVPDQIDNCPYIKNRDQLDTDSDKRGDACDNCAAVANPDQSDVNGNAKGDVCDEDADGDGVLNAKDNCALVPNPSQRDTNNNAKGDVCDADMDGDGVPNLTDNCPTVYNPDQKTDGIQGKVCDYDEDKDGVQDAQDNCPGVYNPDQKRTLAVKLDRPNGRAGDACNPDIDDDSILNPIDNCAAVVNNDQSDSDHDGVGDACDKRWCFVVSRQDKDACLDPDGTFQVYSPTMPMLDAAGQPIAEERVPTGQPMRLRLFANRTNVAMRYTWTVTSRPQGSSAVVENPQGAVALSTPWEYHYQDNAVATLTPDLPGKYVLKVAGEQVFADPVNANWPRNAEYLVTINAEGNAVSSGCSAAPGAAGQAGGPIAAGFLAAALVLFASRRRQAQRS